VATQDTNQDTLREKVMSTKWTGGSAALVLVLALVPGWMAAQDVKVRGSPTNSCRRL
jgi:hypothetical protein